MSDTASAAVELLNASDTSTATPSDASTPSTPAAPADKATAPAATPQEQWFLEVNERTRYKSAEDAKKGFLEAQSKLGGWNEIAQAWGDDLKDPKYVNELLTELAAIRQKNQQASQATPAASGTKSDAATVQAAASGDKVAYDSLNPEWKAHVDMLKRLGYVTQDSVNQALQPLTQQVERLTQEQQVAYQAKIDHAVSDGTQILERVMKESGVNVTDELLQSVGKRIGAAIDRDSYDERGNVIPNSLADQFLRGNAEVRSKIISDEFSIYKTFGENYATAKTASYVKEKTAAQASQPRTLPQGSPPVSTPRKGRMSDDERKAKLNDILGQGGFR